MGNINSIFAINDGSRSEKPAFVYENDSTSLLVKGHSVRLTDVTEELKKSRHELKILQIFALNTVYIDADLELVGRQLSVIVIAPTWVIVDERKINLNGRDGIGVRRNFLPHKTVKTVGRHGSPGYPGKPAGSFFGVAHTIIDGHHLTITARGGRGSQGQDGTDGADITTDVDTSTSIFYDERIETGETYLIKYKIERISFKIENVQFDSSRCKRRFTYLVYGEDGGCGGKGGISGNSGDVDIIEVDNEPSRIVVINSGLGDGADGKSGKRHKATLCFHVNVHYHTISNYFETVDNILVANNEIKSNKVGIPCPNDKVVISEPWRLIKNYELYLIKNLCRLTDKDNSIDFLRQLEDNETCNLCTSLDLIRYVNEFIELHSTPDKLVDLESICELLSYTRKRQEPNILLDQLRNAVLAEIINERTGSNLVIDIDGYLESVLESFLDMTSADGKIRAACREKTVRQMIDEHEKYIKTKLRELDLAIEKLQPKLRENEKEIETKQSKLLGEIENAKSIRDRMQKIQPYRDAKDTIHKVINLMCSFLRGIASAVVPCVSTIVIDRAYTWLTGDDLKYIEAPPCVNMDAESLEKCLYDLISFMVKMEDAIKSQSPSASKMIIKKWEVKTFLKKLQSKFRRILDGFQGNDDIIDRIEAIDLTFETLIDLHDRTERYIEFKEYFAGIVSICRQDYESACGDVTLDEAMAKLQLKVSKNFIEKHYEHALDAFAQHMFPFTEYHDSLVSNNGNTHVERIKMMKRILACDKATVTPHDAHIHSYDFCYEDSSHEPFFTWSGAEYRDEISKLLVGEAVVFVADVGKSCCGKNAIKFNVVEIRLASKVWSLQQELDDRLDKVVARVVHAGSSRYRCGEEYYLRCHEPQEIVHNFRKDVSNYPTHSNRVYDKLKSAHAVLSPYTMWTVKLESELPGATLALLSEYAKSVDVMLVGKGQFVDDGADFQSSTLQKIYTKYISYT